MAALAFLLGFAVGAGIGALVAGEDGARWGAVAGAVLIGWTPWRRWLVRKIKEAEEDHDAAH